MKLQLPNSYNLLFLSLVQTFTSLIPIVQTIHPGLYLFLFNLRLLCSHHPQPATSLWWQAVNWFNCLVAFRSWCLIRKGNFHSPMKSERRKIVIVKSSCSVAVRTRKIKLYEFWKTKLTQMQNVWRKHYAQCFGFFTFKSAISFCTSRPNVFLR